MSLNTFINVLDQISSAWDGFKVMADHVRKVSFSLCRDSYSIPNYRPHGISCRNTSHFLE